MKRKILSILLSVAMVMVMMPSMAFADSTEGCSGGATCGHAAAIGSVHYDTLQEAVNAAENGQTISLLKDIELNSAVQLTKSVTIDGLKAGAGSSCGEGCYTVSVKDTSGGRVFNLDGSIGNGVVDNSTVTLQNIRLVGPTSQSNSRGVSVYKTNGLHLKIKNAYVSAAAYAVNIASLNENIVVDITDSECVGWCAIQTWSPVTINIDKSILHGTNEYIGDGIYSFATIVVNQCSVASNISVTNSDLVAESCDSKDTIQEMLSIQNINNTGSQAYPEGNTLKFIGCRFIAKGTWKDDEGNTYNLTPLYRAEGSNTILVDGERYYVPSYGSWIIDEFAQVASIMRDTGKMVYGSLDAALYDVKEGETITLYDDVKLSETINLDSNLTIDLNGHNILAEDFRAFHIKGGDVKITGQGEISSNKVDDAKKFDSASSVIRVGDNTGDERNTSLTIGKDVRVSSNHCYGIAVFGSKTTEEVIINGTVAVTGSAPAVSGNGTAGYGNTNIIVNGTISADKSNAIYHPQSGALTINGTVIGKGGIEAKSGNTSVSVGSSAVITATATDEEIANDKNNNGCSSTGYALALVENNAYAGNPTAVVSGGTITGIIGVIADDVVEVDKKAKITITGGTFSVKPASDYIAPGYLVSGSGPYTVYKYVAPPTESTDTKTETTPEGDKVTTETTTNTSTGTTTEKVTTEKTDGTKVESTTVTDKNGNTSSTTVETATDGSKTEVKEEVKTETKTDGTVVKTENTVTVETDKDGNKTEITVEKESVTNTDGSTSEKTTTTNADKSQEIVEVETSTNSFDNKVAAETTTTISADGEKTVQQTTTINTKLVGEINVEVKKDAEGNATDATAEINREGKDVAGGVKGLLNGNHVKQIVEALGDDVVDVTITTTISTEKGDKSFTVTANTEDLKAGNELCIVAVDEKGNKTLVNAKSYNVTSNGSVSLTLKDGSDYELITKEEKDLLVKAIKATIQPASKTKSVTKGKTSTMALKKTLNKDNVSKITYSSGNKSVATVSKTGKITTKKKGTVTIKATVTLKDGSKKTVYTKVTVK